MAIKTRSDLLVQVSVLLPDNTTEEIEAEDVRVNFFDTIDSFVSKKGDTGIEGKISYATVVSISDQKDIVHKKYVDDADELVWHKAGDTLMSRGYIGSSNAIGFDFWQNSGSVGGLADNTGNFYFGRNSEIANTRVSVNGGGATSATFSQQWANSSGTVYAYARDDGRFGANRYEIAGLDFARFNNTLGNFLLGNTTLADTEGTNNLVFGRVPLAAIGAYTRSFICCFGNGAFNVLQTSSGNTGFGFRVGFNTTTGSRNTYIGDQAGLSNVTGSDQISLGRLAGADSAATGINQIVAIGNSSVVRQANTLVAGSNSHVLSRIVFGRGESFTNVFENTVITAHLPSNISNQNAGGSIQLAPTPARGTGIAGNVELMYSPQVASGTTLQSYVSAMLVQGSTGNVGLWGSSFGNGSKVVFVANATTDSSAAPVGGAILQAKAGAFFARTTSNDFVCFAGKSVTTPTSYNHNIGETTIVFNGGVGQTITPATSFGKNTFLFIINATGNPVSVTGFGNIQGGKTMILHDDGTTIRQITL
jgi:hypothetical protein